MNNKIEKIDVLMNKVNKMQQEIIKLFNEFMDEQNEISVKRQKLLNYKLVVLQVSISALRNEIESTLGQYLSTNEKIRTLTTLGALGSIPIQRINLLIGELVWLASFIAYIEVRNKTSRVVNETTKNINNLDSELKGTSITAENCERIINGRTNPDTLCEESDFKGSALQTLMLANEYMDYFIATQDIDTLLNDEVGMRVLSDAYCLDELSLKLIKPDVLSKKLSKNLSKN